MFEWPYKLVEILLNPSEILLLKMNCSKIIAEKNQLIEIESSYDMVPRDFLTVTNQSISISLPNLIKFMEHKTEPLVLPTTTHISVYDNGYMIDETLAQSFSKTMPSLSDLIVAPNLEELNIDLHHQSIKIDGELLQKLRHFDSRTNRRMIEEDWPESVVTIIHSGAEVIQGYLPQLENIEVISPSYLVMMNLVAPKLDVIDIDVQDSDFRLDVISNKTETDLDFHVYSNYHSNIKLDIQLNFRTNESINAYSQINVNWKRQEVNEEVEEVVFHDI